MTIAARAILRPLIIPVIQNQIYTGLIERIQFLMTDISHSLLKIPLITRFARFTCLCRCRTAHSNTRQIYDWKRRFLIVLLRKVFFLSKGSGNMVLCLNIILGNKIPL
jgi:hypothetical protein